MAEDTLMETNSGDNITREQVSLVMKSKMVAVISKFPGVGPDEGEGGLGS